MTDQDEKTQALFIQLVLTFQMAAWQQMGKIKNPLTDKIERNLEQARYSIDMLEAIRKKTAGNLIDAEKHLLDHAISELQLNFVDEAQKNKRSRKIKRTSKTRRNRKLKKRIRTQGPEGKKKPGEQKSMTGNGMKYQGAWSLFLQVSGSARVVAFHKYNYSLIL